jgi:hypothetical protein
VTVPHPLVHLRIGVGQLVGDSACLGLCLFQRHAIGKPSEESEVAVIPPGNRGQVFFHRQPGYCQVKPISATMA